MNQQKHNPDYKLVETTIFLDGRFITLVYGETNEGENKGLELYFKHNREDHFYSSRRYALDKVPATYKLHCETLQNYVIHGTVQNGNKLTIS